MVLVLLHANEWLESKWTANAFLKLIRQSVNSIGLGKSSNPSAVQNGTLELASDSSRENGSYWKEKNIRVMQQYLDCNTEM
jgi:hypothetical protein